MNFLVRPDFIWNSLRASAILLVAAILTPSGVAADDATPAPPDSDGPSRGALFFNLEKQKLQELGAAALGSALAPNFAFPKNTRDDALFGVDVSHWDEDNCGCTFNWTALADKKVVFAYVKASHGDNKDPDPRFNKSWQALAKEPRIIRGAYHFFSSSSDPLTQAKSFVDKVNKAGGQLQTDLPPAMDLEWDVRTENDETIIDPATGKAKDFWKGQSPDTIIKKVLTWLEYVKKETGRTPIIYTNYQWWLNNIKDSKKIEQLKDYIVWIADYSVEHTKPENPELPNDWNWKLWQFTAKGDVTSAGIKFKPSASGETIDVSMFKGTMEDFLLVFDVAPRSAVAKKDDSTTDQKLAVLTEPAKKDDKTTVQPPQPKPAEEAKKDDKAIDQPPQPKPAEEAKKDDNATVQTPQPKPAEEAKKDDKATDQPPQPKPTEEAKKDDKAIDQPPQPKPAEEAKKDDKAIDQPPQPKPAEEAKKDDKATDQPPQPKPTEEAKKDDKAIDQPPQPKPVEEAKKDDKAIDQPQQPKPVEEAKKDDKATDQPQQPKPAEEAKKDDKTADKQTVVRLDEPKKADAQAETQQTVVGPKPDVKSTTATSPAAADKRSIAEIVLKNGRIIRVDINIDPVLLARIVATVDKP